MGVSVSSSASILDRIRNIHGPAVASELLTVEVADKQLGFKAVGMVSSANYSVKKTSLLLFINRMLLRPSMHQLLNCVSIQYKILNIA